VSDERYGSAAPRISRKSATRSAVRILRQPVVELVEEIGAELMTQRRGETRSGQASA
jgi:hypothetical protein